jgi:hypothetical protein
MHVLVHLLGVIHTYTSMKSIKGVGSLEFGLNMRGKNVYKVYTQIYSISYVDISDDVPYMLFIYELSSFQFGFP